MNQTIIQDKYTIPKVIVGCWQLAGGHGSIDSEQAIDNLFQLYTSGFSAFDGADIYTGVEELFGKFLKKYSSQFKLDQPVRIHTKFVPDLDILPSITAEYVESIIDRSLLRLGVEILDLVQFHWWDYTIPKYVDVAIMLQQLQRKGKIRQLGVTNFDSARIEEMHAAGVTFVSNQIQYSVIDSRPEYQMLSTLQKLDMKAICYGTIAGGLLSNKYLGVSRPSEPHENRSITKYLLVLDEYINDWDQFQEILQVLQKIAQKHSVDIATVSSAYILHQRQVGSVIIGARNLQHIDMMKKVAELIIDSQDIESINNLIAQLKKPDNIDIYGFERARESLHAKIMKYNLNSKIR